MIKSPVPGAKTGVTRQALSDSSRISHLSYIGKKFIRIIRLRIADT